MKNYMQSLDLERSSGWRSPRGFSQYGYDRKWVAYRKPVSSHRARGLAKVVEGDIVERVEFPRSGMTRKVWYYQVKDDEPKKLSGREEVDEILDVRE